jgi:hypothetical protein
MACERIECIFKSIENMMSKMKEEVAAKQSIAHPEQIAVAGIYYVVANTLAEACRRMNSEKFEGCAAKEKNFDVSMDTFILLSRLKEDGHITEQYAGELFEALIKMKPELEEKIREDRSKGLI